MNDTPQNIQVRTESVQNIADSIRSKNHSNQKYKIGEMSGAIDEMKVAIPNTMLTIEHNGVYDVSTDEKVSVEVPVPSGAIEITQNGRTDVKEYIYADVNVPEPTGTKEITSNGTHNVKDYEFANVQVPLPSGTTNITSNGSYNVEQYKYADVNIPSSTPVPNFIKFQHYQGATGSVFSQSDWNAFLTALDFTNCTSGYSMFGGFSQIVNIPTLQNFKPTNCRNFASYCTSLKSVNSFDTSLCTDFQEMFKNSILLEDVPVFNMSSVQYNSGIRNMFSVGTYTSGTFSLTNDSLNNILQSLVTIQSYMSTKTLVYVIENLSTWLANDGGATRTRIQSLPFYATFTSSGWRID